MKRLSIPLAFDWDEGNINKNLKKHGIHHKESEEIFFNKPLRMFKDKKHSSREKRFVVLGLTNKKKFLCAVFTIRRKKVRIISIRAQSKRERKIYEQKE